MDLKDPTLVALLGAEAFDKAGLPHALYGGLLVAAYGEPRETRDADFAVVDLPAPIAGRALEQAGLRTQVEFQDLTFGGLFVSRLAIIGAGAFTGLNTIDLVRPRSPRYAREAVSRSATVTLRDREVRVLTPEDFIIFKALSTRDRDLDDASALRRSRDLIDSALIEKEIRALAAEIPDFDVSSRLAEIRSRAERSPERGV
jgi:hypothetical protein